MDQGLISYRDHLREWADFLVSTGPRDPVFLQGICKRLGVVIRRDPSVPKFTAYLSIDEDRILPVAIRLPDVRKIGNFERICIAHELAHLYLLQEYNFLPKTHSEYWQQEELCDDFARHLLIPTDTLLVKLRENLQEPAPAGYLMVVEEISELTLVPWIHSARRVSEVSSRVFFLRCRKQVTGEFRIIASSMPRSLGRARKIALTSPLHNVLNDLLSITGEPRVLSNYDISEELLKCPSLSPLFPRSLRAVAVVDGGIFPEIKMAVVVEE